MLGIGDKVEILQSNKKSEIGKISTIMSICGKYNDRIYYLAIDGEERERKEYELKLIKKNEH